MLQTELAAGRKRKISETRADRVFDVMNYVILTICLLLVAYPLYFVVIASISDTLVVGINELHPERLKPLLISKAQQKRAAQELQLTLDFGEEEKKEE